MIRNPSLSELAAALLTSELNYFRAGACVESRLQGEFSVVPGFEGLPAARFYCVSGSKEIGRELMDLGYTVTVELGLGAALDEIPVVESRRGLGLREVVGARVSADRRAVYEALAKGPDGHDMDARRFAALERVKQGARFAGAYAKAGRGGFRLYRSCGLQVITEQCEWSRPLPDDSA
jgi:hypothetical protein